MTLEIPLTDVEAFIASGTRERGFPPQIEATYQAQRQSYRAKALRAGIIPALIVYNLFLPADCFLMPKTAYLAVILHALISAWIIAMGYALRSIRRRHFRELIAVSIPVLMAVQVLVICALNGWAEAGDYPYVAIMIAVYMNVNVRPDFSYALWASGFLWLTFLVFATLGDASMSARLVGCFTMAAGLYLTLAANWRMERDGRHTFLRRLQDQLRRSHAEREARRDPLTGLCNRRELERQSERAWAAAKPGSHMAVIMCDIDRFKVYNDRYGHPAGDLCLKRVAAALLSAMRSASDLAVRVGGEEFVILLPDTDACSAVQMAERIRRALEALAIPHEGALSGPGCVTASLGIMAGKAEMHSLPELMAGADAALYAAKRNGRNQVWPPFVVQANPASSAHEPRVVTPLRATA